MPAGRPTEPVPQNIADELVEWISEGKTLREFCRLPGKPHYSTVYDWQEKDETFALRIARARLIGEDVIAMECLEIADDGSNDWETRQTAKGVDYQAHNPEVVNRSRLRVDTRLKLLAKWNPKKYGEKVDMNLSGSVDLGLAERMGKARERVKKAK
jgi:hypothetical protein